MFFKKRVSQTTAFERSFYSLGTLCSIKIFPSVNNMSVADKNIEKHMQEILDGAEILTKEFDDKFSMFKETSEVSRINLNSGKRFTKVSGDTYFLIEKAVEYCEISEGSMDITIGPLSKIWSESIKRECLPKPTAVAAAKRLVDYRRIAMNESQTSVMLEQENMKIDLGSIAKGFCADLTRDFLEDRQIEKGIINYGGNIVVIGSDTSNKPWRVGIQHPYLKRGDYIGTLELEDLSVVTSGGYERCFEQDGQKLHHIIDSKTGWPLISEIASITIISKASIDGDGLTTSTFMIGLEKAKALIAELSSIEGVIITNDKRIYVSEGIKANFKLEDSEYVMIN